MGVGPTFGVLQFILMCDGYQYDKGQSIAMQGQEFFVDAKTQARQASHSVDLIYRLSFV